MRTRDEIKALFDKVLTKVNGLEAQVSYNFEKSIATRFGENSITQNMGGESESLRFVVYKGNRSGSYITNKLDDASLDRLVRTAVKMAEDSPEDPEYVPLPGPQEYLKMQKGYFDDVNAVTPDNIAGDIKVVVDMAKSKGFKASGLFEAGAEIDAIANTNGLFGFDSSTNVSYSTTVHGPVGSGKAEISRNSYAQINIDEIAEKAVGNAAMAQNPVEIEPGDYDVIFEPSAMLEFFAFMLWNMNARDADEGTTVFADKIGQKLFSDKVNISIDIDDSELPVPIFGDAGLAVRPRAWVKDGVLERLRYSRYWAKEKGLEPDPSLYPAFMRGEDRSIDDLVKMCKKGLLVKNLWYIRYVDRKELLLTGMTRDGVFLIEDGKIVGPVKNMRWNESPIHFLDNVVAMSRAERVESYAKLPGILSKDFTFSSKTDSL